MERDTASRVVEDTQNFVEEQVVVSSCSFAAVLDMALECIHKVESLGLEDNLNFAVEPLGLEGNQNFAVEPQVQDKHNSVVRLELVRE